VPRDRAGSFDPCIVRKGRSRLDGFNDRIIALYARGMTTRDIRAHLRELYDVDVSPDLISRVTDAVVEEMTSWQARPLDTGRIPAVVANRAGRRMSCPDTPNTRRPPAWPACRPAAARCGSSTLAAPAQATRQGISRHLQQRLPGEEGHGPCG
jgi:hypothetical protein